MPFGAQTFYHCNKLNNVIKPDGSIFIDDKTFHQGSKTKKGRVCVEHIPALILPVAATAFSL